MSATAPYNSDADADFATTVAASQTWTELETATGLDLIAIVKRVERLGLSTSHISGTLKLARSGSLPRLFVLKYDDDKPEMTRVSS
jgi:hypothetical protein